MANNRPIGIFDSGVGGLSVLLEIKKLLPKESFVFLADQKHNPYGVKTKKQLQNLSVRITKFLSKYHIKLLVIACNTATCYVLAHLRKKFDIPIIGVVPAIKPAAQKTKNKKIAVMSTPATARSSYLSSLIAQHARGNKVLKVGCHKLEESIEYLDTKKISKLLDIYSKKIKDFKADVIVLGCTHFPFIKREIRKRVSSSVEIIDSGEAIASRVNFILKSTQELSSIKLKDIYYTTGLDLEKFSKVAQALLKYKITAQKAII